MGTDVRARHHGHSAGRTNGDTSGAVVGLAGTLRTWAGLLRAPTDHGLWPHVALAHRYDGAGAVLPGDNAGSWWDARYLAGRLQHFWSWWHACKPAGMCCPDLPGLTHPRHRASFRPASYDGCLTGGGRSRHGGGRYGSRSRASPTGAVVGRDRYEQLRQNLDSPHWRCGHRDVAGVSGTLRGRSHLRLDGRWRIREWPSSLSVGDTWDEYLHTCRYIHTWWKQLSLRTS